MGRTLLTPHLCHIRSIRFRVSHKKCKRLQVSRQITQCRIACRITVYQGNVNLQSILFSVVLVLPTASTDPPAATVDSETITLNSGTLQTFEILPVSNTSQS